MPDNLGWPDGEDLLWLRDEISNGGTYFHGDHQRVNNLMASGTALGLPMIRLSARQCGNTEGFFLLDPADSLSSGWTRDNLCYNFARVGAGSQHIIWNLEPFLAGTEFTVSWRANTLDAGFIHSRLAPSTDQDDADNTTGVKSRVITATVDNSQFRLIANDDVNVAQICNVTLEVTGEP